MPRRIIILVLVLLATMANFGFNQNPIHAQTDTIVQPTACPPVGCAEGQQDLGFALSPTWSSDKDQFAAIRLNPPPLCGCAPISFSPWIFTRQSDGTWNQIKVFGASFTNSNADPMVITWQNGVPIISFGTYAGTSANATTGEILSNWDGRIILTQNPPRMEVNPNIFDLTVQQNSAPLSETITVTNVGGGFLDWTAYENSTWLGFGNVSQETGKIEVVIDPTNLEIGVYSAEVRLSAPGSSWTVPITLRIVETPQLSVTPSSLTFNVVQGGTPPPAQAVKVTGAREWFFSTDAQWLILVAQTGGDTLSVVTFGAQNMETGTYNANITIGTPGFADVTVPVTLEVTERDQRPVDPIYLPIIIR